MNPYREAIGQAEEDDMWSSLDDALSRAFSDPHWAWGTAWQVARDAKSMGLRELEQAAMGLLCSLFPT